ncbi:WD repeat-containing protein 55-like [Rhopilema esculentum]|uniref:WD repeat-containing protein 55-like n=1 Tax=Rhopilema esculentum TaxID=499914 RepID=UPI0031E3E4EC|eukprot:gene341-10001_t
MAGDSVTLTEESNEIQSDDEVDNQRRCPRNIILKSQIVDIATSPTSDIIAAGKINGKITVCSFSTSEPNAKIYSLKHHRKACRSIAFSSDGKKLLTSSKDKTIQVVNMDTGQILNKIENAHNTPIYKIVSIQDKWIASGDETGNVKLWDQHNCNCIAEFKECKDFISDMVCDKEGRNLLCTCGDGTLSVFNVRGKKLRSQSDQLDDELISLAIMKSGTKVVCGGGDGTLNIYSWGKWGDVSDRFPGHMLSVDSLCKMTEDIVITGGTDGKIRSVHIQPNYFISEIGKHGNLPIERLQISPDGDIVASCSHDNVIKFWDISCLHEHEPITGKAKTKKRKNEISASRAKDFFADL